MTTLEQAAATLQVIVPGWLTLKVFYARAFPTRSSNLDTVLWALVISLPIYGVATVFTARFGSTDQTIILLVALGIGAGVGELAALGWRVIVRSWPHVWVKFVPTGWDAYLGHPSGGWLQVRTSDGLIYHGWVEHASNTVEADAPDLYLRDPAYVGADGTATRVDGVEGVLIPRASVVSVFRFEPAESNKEVS